MVGGSHLERRGPSPQGAGSVYWLDRGATAPTAASGGRAATLRGHLERPMVGGSHLERRGPSPQGAGSVYWLDRGATAPTAASGGQQFAFVCPARVPLSQLGQSVHEADVGAFEFGLGKHLGSSGGATSAHGGGNCAARSLTQAFLTSSRTHTCLGWPCGS